MYTALAALGTVLPSEAPSAIRAGSVWYERNFAPPRLVQDLRYDVDALSKAGLFGSAGSGGSGQNNTDVAKILCRICGDSAVRHVHYGGHCCFSCKAFFRRV